MHDSIFLDQEGEPMSSHKGPPDKPNKPGDMLIKENLIFMKRKKFYFNSEKNETPSNEIISLNCLKDILKKRNEFQPNMWKNFLNQKNFDLSQLNDIDAQRDLTFKTLNTEENYYKNQLLMPLKRSKSYEKATDNHQGSKPFKKWENPNPKFVEKNLRCFFK
jgi:hypothetical protein